MKHDLDWEHYTDNTMGSSASRNSRPKPHIRFIPREPLQEKVRLNTFVNIKLYSQQCVKSI